MVWLLHPLCSLYYSQQTGDWTLHLHSSRTLPVFSVSLLGELCGPTLPLRCLSPGESSPVTSFHPTSHWLADSRFPASAFLLSLPESIAPNQLDINILDPGGKQPTMATTAPCRMLSYCDVDPGLSSKLTSFRMRDYLLYHL